MSDNPFQEGLVLYDLPPQGINEDKKGSVFQHSFLVTSVPSLEEPLGKILPISISPKKLPREHELLSMCLE